MSRRPKTFFYPTGYIDHAAARLRRELRRIKRGVKRKKTSKAVARDLGVKAIEDSFKSQLDRFNEYVRKKGLVGVRDVEEDLVKARDEAVRGWLGIVDDMP